MDCYATQQTRGLLWWTCSESSFNSIQPRETTSWNNWGYSWNKAILRDYLFIKFVVETTEKPRSRKDILQTQGGRQIPNQSQVPLDKLCSLGSAQTQKKSWHDPTRYTHMHCPRGPKATSCPLRQALQFVAEGAFLQDWRRQSDGVKCHIWGYVGQRSMASILLSSQEHSKPCF